MPDPFLPLVLVAVMILPQFTAKLRALTLAVGTGLVVACGSADAANRTPAPKAPADTLTDSALMATADAGRYEGSDKAPIWIVMISDFQCPYCKEWHDSTLTAIRREYVATGKVRLAYLNLPLQGHKHAMVMAKAGMCASAQRKFWEYADAMFSRQKSVGNLVDVNPMLISLADSLKLDTAAFSHCQRSNAISSLVQSDLRQADKAKISATPSFFVGQFILEGAVPLKSFRMAVDSALVLAAKGR
ncbi:MAG: thioredoxin domain-containing protein [Gemmatimonas sp.]